MKATSIGWTDFSSNPIKYRDRATGKVVWSCVKAAEECRYCYSEALALRWGKGHPFTRPNLALVEPFLDAKELRTLLRSTNIRGKRLFLGDMTDIFGSWVPTDWLDQIFAVFAERIDVTWQILTKRPKRLAEYTNDPEMPARVDRIMRERSGLNTEGHLLRRWPLSNVIAGTSAGSDQTARLFIPELLKANLAYRSISVEPLIAPIDLEPYLVWYDSVHHEPLTSRGDIHWLMVGGESGAGYRPMELDWLRLVVEQGREAGVSVFVKQDAHRLPEQRGRIPDDLWVREFPSIAQGAAS